MPRPTQTALAAAFRDAHTRPPLVLPNAWDAGSARAIELAGASAIATTSAGVAWARGQRDGERLTADEAVAAVQTIAAAVSVPVSADIESGYGDGTPDDVARSVRAVLDAGAVGVNLEDSLHRDGRALWTIEEQAERIRAARQAGEGAGVQLFINARVDVFLAAVGESASRLSHTLERANAYLDAGADGVFVPGVAALDTISALARGIAAPVNVMAGPGAASVQDLTAAGAARISLGPSLALSALGLARRAAAEALRDGTYASLEGAPSFADAQAMFGAGPVAGA